MTKEQALQIVLQAVEVAQQKGSFTLKDAKVIATAVEVLSTPTTEVKETPKTEEVVNKE